jgi:hypothetical protein
MNDVEFVEVSRAENGVEAHLLKAALEDAGIPTRITEETVAALRPNLWWAAPRVWVAKADAARAAEIIREINDARETRSTSGNTDQ